MRVIGGPLDGRSLDPGKAEVIAYGPEGEPTTYERLRLTSKEDGDIVVLVPKGTDRAAALKSLVDGYRP